MKPGAAIGAELCLEIDATDDEGAGLAAESDLELHVAGALPGERVRAVLEHVSPHKAGGRRAAWARLTTVQRPSAERVPAVCPGYGQCGGCPLQHWAYEAQLGWKTGRVSAALAKEPRLSGTVVEDCVPAPRPLGYRNQGKYVFGHGADGRLILGAYAPRSHRLVDLEGCRLVEPAVDETARRVRERLVAHAVVPFDERRRTGDLRYVVVRVNARGERLVTLVTAATTFAPGPAIAAELRAAVPAIAGVVQNVNGTAGNVIFGADERLLGGAAELEEQVAGVGVLLSSRAFFQLNRDVAALAYTRIHELCPAGAHVVVDAYAGVGGIALGLAGKAREVVAIEDNPAATTAGARAAERAGAANVRFVTADAARGLAALDRAEMVVLNPPRAGCAPPALDAVARLRPGRLAYLSCNPETLARDLVSLLGHGFSIERITPLDMLPHTAHVETLAVLRG